MQGDPAALVLKIHFAYLVAFSSVGAVPMLQQQRLGLQQHTSVTRPEVM
jgi:hypothetical protein